MTHHLLGVALFNLLLVSTGVLALELVGAYTVHQPHALWTLYLAVGLLVPLSVVAIQAAATKRLRD